MRVISFGSLTLCLFSFLVISSPTESSPSQDLSSQDYKYLENLARDTWNGMDYFRAPETGFSNDSNLRPDGTNTTNVGLYLVSVVGAEKMGLITAAQARERINRILTSIKKIDHWKGFLKNHLNVKGLTRAAPGPNAVSDFNKLTAALLVIRQAYPDIKPADELFKRVDWSALWKQDRLYQAFDVTDGSLKFWGHGWLASDVRMAVFLGVATGGLPVKAFARMERNKVKQYGFEYYRPAWDFAGLFMHGMGNLFMDERFTAMGLSTANFAYVQMLFARNNGYPVWGWSACHRPAQGYTVNGLLSQAVITPHASALVIDYYPRKVIANLKRQEAMGCRKPFKEHGQEYDFGFWDAVNVTTGEISHLYYTGLDQAMLFISLVNFLKPGCIWELFAKDPVVRQGLKKLPYFTGQDEKLAGLYAQRDKEPLPLPAAVSEKPRVMIIDDFENKKVNSLGYQRRIQCERAPPQACQMSLVKDSVRKNVLKIEYDLSRHDRANAIFIEPLKKLDASGYNAT
ncbi:DUF3131 domain-containing protein, partial [bacterium]|nr:DUF3131 domain-containing protein [bacterium]